MHQTTSWRIREKLEKPEIALSNICDIILSMSEHLPTKAELLTVLGDRKINYQETDKFETINGSVVTVGETSRISVRKGADPRTKRRTIQRALDAIDSGRTQGKIAVIVSSRRLPLGPSRLVIKESTWRTRNHLPF